MKHSLVLGYIGGFIVALGLSAAPAIQFGPVTHYTNTVGNVDRICTGGFNGNVHMDLVTVGNLGITLWTNDGVGGFAVKTNWPALGAARVVVTGDLNNDGKLDLLTANLGGSLSAFLGNGDGNFSRVDTSISVIQSRFGLAVGDFNGDGSLDAALADYGIKILLGNGDGTFAAFTNYFVGSTLSAAAVADFNGDQKLDLVTANYSSSSMSVYFGNGDGTFSAPTNYSGDFSEYHYAVAIGDFNNNGKPDLATVNFYNSSASVRLNNGNGTFGSETRYQGILGAHSITTGDFNCDGNLDLVAGQASSSHALAILPGNGNGTFGRALTNFTGISGTDYQSLAVADFDGDGLVDLATTSGSINAISVRLNQTTALLRIEPLPFQIKLSWPNWTGYQLETSTNLLGTINWVTVTDAPSLVDNLKVLTNSTPGNSQFYRLRKPLP
jgi:hypothetical protein